MSARRWTLAGLALLLCPASGFSSAKDNAGTSGAAFLKIAPGARPVGMGEAFTAVADDVHAIYWNPAGLGTLKTPELTGMHMQHIQELKYEFAAFAYPTAMHGTWALAISNLHVDAIDRRTEETDEPAGSFDASDTAYAVGYGYRVSSRLALGGSFKYIRQSLDSIKANAYAFDGGLLYDLDWQNVRLGAAVQNAGTKVKFQNESDPLPLTFRLGASAPLFVRNFLISSDVILPRDHQIGAALGGEYRQPISEGIAASLRSGYRTDSDVDGLKGISAGGGLEVGRFAFDFAWVPFGDLGNAYRFGLHIKFGDPGSGGPEPKMQRHASAADLLPRDAM